jgi:hypothetical protein
MEVKTKFNIDDTVYFMNNDMPVKATISGVDVFIGLAFFSDGTSKSSNSEQNPNKYYFLDYFSKNGVCENDLYATKEEIKEAVFAAL